ncbi:MAG: 2Fe-2S iron-sulfur cluster binding domain-containing protein [Sandaracinaceae bacterium]|nr:2Fe-2S iron-sulfur cluster binding domain-containing protein [Sandaracinaceae bacterium]
MPKVRFVKEGLEVEVEPGETILAAAKKIGAPEGDRCGGVCACSTCHVYVVEGYDALEDASPPEDEELDILEKAFDVRATSRLGCQAKVHSDVAVEISDESFQAFLDEHPDDRDRALSLRPVRE